VKEGDVAGFDAIGAGLLRFRKAIAFHQDRWITFARRPAGKEPHRPIG